MEELKMITYWVGYAYYVYVFGYASLYKVFQKSSMMQNMKALGFDRVPTIIIGICEFLGVVLMIVGIFIPALRNMAILFLFPFAVGAFTAHMAHKEYRHFYNALTMCILTVIMLWADSNFSILI
jgi:uncharacterized membrane protein YphA (DoxX/SURF4 family)